MELERRAVIDVGTNSVKLLVADVTGKKIEPVKEESRQTRLGEGFYRASVLQPGAIKVTAEAVANFARTAAGLQAASVVVIATSAAREARNADELHSAIRNSSGLELQVISGDQEADWAFQGVSNDPRFVNTPLLLMETGGGSTQFLLGHGQHKHFRQSFPLGTIRLLEQSAHSDPPLVRELASCRLHLKVFFEQQVLPSLEPALRREQQSLDAGCKVVMVGTGGTATILARIEAGMDDFDRGRIERTTLDLHRLKWHVNHLWSMTLHERKHVVGLPPNRADVILMGAAIYEAALEQLRFPDLNISTRGLRFAALVQGHSS